MVRVLVCGGRTFGEFAPEEARLRMTHEERAADTARVHRQRNLVMVRLYQLCDEQGCWSEPDAYGNTIPIDIVIIHGGAKGADSLADQWAVVNWVRFEEFRADWNKHGKSAGMIRNLQMITEGKPDVVLAFPGGPGTRNMIKQARAHGIRVIEVKDDDEAPLLL